MDWPPYSSDLSPIENLWAILQRKLHVNNINNRRDLLEKINNLWNNDPDVLRSVGNLVESMTRRVATCVAACGGALHY